MPSKTGAFDDTVVLDHPRRQWLGELLLAVVDKAHPGRLLLPAVNARDFSRHLKQVASSLGITVVPYMARHGGASDDRATKVRTLDEVRKRGRWLSESSTRRYEKHGKLQGRLAKMPRGLLQHREACAAAVADVMAFRVVPPRPRLQ